MGREDPAAITDALCHWLRLSVRFGRIEWPVPSAAGARHPVARYLFRGWAFSPDHGRGGNLRDIWRYLRDLHAHALPWHGWPNAPLLTVHRSGLPNQADTAAEVHHVCGVHHHQRSAYFPLQSVLEYAERSEGAG